MAKATGKRGHRNKAEEVLSRKATHHHHFVGEAEPERAQSRAVEQDRIRRDQEELEKEVVQQMAQELEQVAGVAEQPAGARGRPAAGPAPAPRSAQERPRFERPRTLREGYELLRDRGPEALDALRAKAEERLEQMPSSLKGLVHLGERAVGLALWPVRAGLRLAGRVLETPAALLRILLARDRTV